MYDDKRRLGQYFDEKLWYNDFENMLYFIQSIFKIGNKYAIIFDKNTKGDITSANINVKDKNIEINKKITKYLEEVFRATTDEHYNFISGNTKFSQ